MKAVYAGSSVPVTDIRSYLYVCNRRTDELEFYIPCHSLSDVQMYVAIGTAKPATQSIQLVNLCNNTAMQLLPDRYVIGKDADGSWYGVFTFADAAPPPLFAIFISLDNDVYFSQAYRYEPCDMLKKVSGCFPISRTDEFGFDCNDIYFGTSTDASDSLGDITLSYDHYAFVRRAKVFKQTPKLTFSSNSRRNFRTTVSRTYEFRCETVPEWYKEYMLAIYSRGFIKIEDVTYQVTDLSFEGVNEDDLTWKPYAKLQVVKDFQFGCEDCTPKNPCCNPTIDSVTQEVLVIEAPGVAIGSLSDCTPGNNFCSFTISGDPNSVLQLQIEMDGFFSWSSVPGSPSHVWVGAQFTSPSGAVSDNNVYQSFPNTGATYPQSISLSSAIPFTVTLPASGQLLINTLANIENGGTAPYLNAGVRIISVNGQPKSIYQSICRGYSTGG